MSTGTAGDDDKLDAELQKLLSGDVNEAKFREPTADERARLAEKKRKLEREVQKEHQARLKQQRKAARKRKRRRLVRRLAWGASALVLVGAVIFAYVKFGRAPGGPNDTQTVANGAVPRGLKTTAPLSQSGPPSDPFSGTPADKWADGAAGITIPAAKPVGQYSASQVEEAYQTTKKLLVAAALDPQTLNGGAPTAFAKLLTQDDRDQFLSGLDKIGLDKQGSPLSTRDEVISFAPGTTKFIGSVIKVHGTMTARATTSDHGMQVLEIDLHYRVVYAVEPPKTPSDWMRVVGQFDGPVQFGDWAEADSPFEPWWENGPGTAGGRCGTKDGFLHPDYPNGPADTTPTHGRTIDPYSLKDVPTDGCANTTGT